MAQCHRAVLSPNLSSGAVVVPGFHPLFEHCDIARSSALGFELVGHSDSGPEVVVMDKVRYERGLCNNGTSTTIIPANIMAAEVSRPLSVQLP